VCSITNGKHWYQTTEGYEPTTDYIYCYQKSKEITEEYAKPGAKIDVSYFTVVVIDCNHKYEDTVTKPATCTENGVMTHTCIDCLDSYTTEIPAKGHNWSEWEITTPATKEAHGIETRTCSDCDAEETRPVTYHENDEYHLGDVNGDGKINVTDISKAAAHVKGKKRMSGDALICADINSDGIVNISDVIRIAAHVKGKRSIDARVRSSIK
jgi:hypothetical protein